MPASTKLIEALEMVAKVREMEREGEDFSSTNDLVDQVLSDYASDDLPNRILADIPVEWPADVVASLFVRLSGRSRRSEEFTRAIGQWLIEGENRRKIEVALAFGNPYSPGLWVVDQVKAEATLTRIALRFPQLKRECDQALHAHREYEKARAAFEALFEEDK